MPHDDLYPPQSPYDTGLKGLCPRCGQGHLFTGFINIAPKCDACDMPFDFADAGDGPAVFVILIAGFIVLGAALYVEINYEPPMWVHMAVFLPMVLVVVLGMLRPLKGLLVALQYRNKAEQGRLVK
ncbi:MAG: hypothetical protein RIQ68_732 [Pseudomonadota bacterium]|jgi:uncharacterized protein (DUF983 family)